MNEEMVCPSKYWLPVERGKLNTSSFYEGLGSIAIDCEAWENKYGIPDLRGIDVRTIALEDTLGDGRSTVRGNHRVIRLLQGGFRLLGLYVLRAFLKNPKLIPEAWIGSEKGPGLYIYFQQAVYVGVNAYFLCLHYNWEIREWECSHWFITDDLGRNSPSAVLRPIHK